MITVTQARENDRTTFCRQFTFNKNGYSNRELDGAIVSGMPVAGLLLGSMPDAEDGSEGTLLKFRENGQEVLFRLLKHGYEGAGSLVQRVDIHSERAYDAGNSNKTDGSDFDVYANGEWLDSLEDAVKSAAVEVPLPCVVGGGTNSAVTLLRKAFVLSSSELSAPFNTVEDGTLLGYFNSDARRIAYYNGQPHKYCGRTPSRANGFLVWQVFATTGRPSSVTANDATCGFRPCLVLPPNFALNPEPNSDGSYSPIR